MTKKMIVLAVLLVCIGLFIAGCTTKAVMAQQGDKVKDVEKVIVEVRYDKNGFGANKIANWLLIYEGKTNYLPITTDLSKLGPGEQQTMGAYPYYYPNDEKLKEMKKDIELYGPQKYHIVAYQMVTGKTDYGYAAGYEKITTLEKV